MFGPAAVMGSPTPAYNSGAVPVVPFRHAKYLAVSGAPDGTPRAYPARRSQ